LISTKLPKPFRKTRVLKLVFITIPYLKFWALFIFILDTFSIYCKHRVYTVWPLVSEHVYFYIELHILYVLKTKIIQNLMLDAFRQRNWVFAKNSTFEIPISFNPDDLNLWYFKLTLFNLTAFIVWTIKGLQHWVATILKLENQSLYISLTDSLYFFEGWLRLLYTWFNFF